MADRELFDNSDDVAVPESDRKVAKCNDLNGAEWTRFSMSVWRDIKKSGEERALKHPALFPTMLADRLMRCFTKGTGNTVLDPFCGSGSTLVAATSRGNRGIGFELSEEYMKLAEQRLGGGDLVLQREYHIYREDARTLSHFIEASSIDFALTSPPYWDILNQKRTADYKDIRNYGNYENDLGNIHDYQAFNAELAKVWEQVYTVLRPGCYFIINVMDLRKGPTFYPYHIDVAQHAQRAGFLFDDLFIWDRGAEYNNLRSLGYPSVFRLNKIHEYLLIFQKPQGDQKMSKPTSRSRKTR